MKFCDKLLKLRKNNNMSQEQLADKLGVSRQAVSKWESASSVPDMEKMMQLCKILNCSLDELVDDGATGNHHPSPNDTKLTWYDYYKEVLNFITKTINMFWSMRLIERLKCLLEMFFLVLIFTFIWTIIGELIHSCLSPILSLLPYTINQLIYSISSFIYQLFGIIFGLLVLIHIFKVRYLDYFITIEDQDQLEKQIEVPIDEQEQPNLKPRQFIEHKKNKIIIRDPKHSSYRFFDFLAKLAIWFIKLMLIFFAIPCIFCFLALTFFLVCSLWYLKDGLIFLGIAITIFGSLLANYLILKIIYYFIVNLKYQFPTIFYLFISSLIIIGVGTSTTFCTYLSFTKPDLTDQITTTTQELTFTDDLVIPFIKYEDVEIIENNDLTNIQITIEHLDTTIPHLYSEEYSTTTNSYKVYHLTYEYDYQADFFEELTHLLTKVKNKQRIDLDYSNYYKITLTTSKDILTKLETNYQTNYQ